MHRTKEATHLADSPLASASSTTGQSPRLSTAVYERILEMIARGDFQQNSRLPAELTLCEKFGASRPVVREALAQLREDGVIVSRQGSGSYVKQRPDPSIFALAPIDSLGDLQRCFEFREGIEPIATALAARRWDDEDRERIEACAAALDRCVTEGEIGTEEDCAFHQAIADATHNAYHRTVQLQLRTHILAGMNVTRSLSLRRPRERTRLVQDEHFAILDALWKRDPDKASENMRTHICNARRRMFEGSGSM
ncbi:FadR/GntR family transcriptional regulator [Roseicyclus sp. F158]|uniref:FadR/GntR family transcriptional regulator n=1 Tax=Tropicimonas omnivorans TaxID=3075590 RepID=A0ABU3DHI7_9RHOB|nr:FadR/GntR family transcriptional regulator [Roseicyclus sp. F158]MDT0683149.1 FadR/GntR family transcriptional regulator [Roseicyclus sp. F158]